MASPSYSALRAFVEVGRHGSLKVAAQHLSVTSGAVSQQIRSLESTFRSKLFERCRGGLKLSDQGLRLFGELASAFEQVDASVAQFRAQTSGETALLVSTTPSLAACWLTSRLGDFTARHPEIDVRLETSIALASFAAPGVDVAIRHGGGVYPGLDSTLLFAPRLVVVAKPGFVARDRLSPSDCLRYPLLQDRDGTAWKAWFEGARLSRVGFSSILSKGPRFENDSLLIEAAAAGQGLAVVRDAYASDAIASGRIAKVSDRSVATDAGYYIVTRPSRAATARAKAFRRWLLLQGKSHAA